VERHIGVVLYIGERTWRACLSVKSQV